MEFIEGILGFFNSKSMGEFTGVVLVVVGLAIGFHFVIIWLERKKR